ncbi:MAG: ribosome-associated translation inhibitor RaiA [Patescibacteria group bacterium]|nr:ribosome-associated translation inhibitor RaiA [Patescibacteria group bacterium]
MNITIKTKNITLTTAIEEYVRKHFGALEKFIKKESDDMVCAVEVGRTTRHHKHGDIFRAEVNIYVKPKSFYASSENEDLYTAIDIVKKEIEREIVSVKKKTIKTSRKIGAKIKKSIKNI